MTYVTLTEQIDAIEFSDDAADLFLKLVDASPTDETGAVVLVAAATMLARQHMALTPQAEHSLVRLGGEFIQLAFRLRDEMLLKAATPSLHVVGGYDA